MILYFRMKHFLQTIRGILQKHEKVYRETITGLVDTDIYLLNFLNITSLYHMLFVNKYFRNLVINNEIFKSFNRCYNRKYIYISNKLLKNYTSYYTLSYPNQKLNHKNKASYLDMNNKFIKLFTQGCLFGDLRVIKYVYSKYQYTEILNINKIYFDFIFINICERDDIAIVNFFGDKISKNNVVTSNSFAMACIWGHIEIALLLSKHLVKDWDKYVHKWIFSKYSPSYGIRRRIFYEICLKGFFEMAKWFYENYYSVGNDIFKIMIDLAAFTDDIIIFKWLYKKYIVQFKHAKKKILYQQIEKIFVEACLNNSIKIGSWLCRKNENQYIVETRNNMIVRYAIYKKFPKDSIIIKKDGNIIKYAIFQQI